MLTDRKIDGHKGGGGLFFRLHIKVQEAINLKFDNLFGNICTICS